MQLIFTAAAGRSGTASLTHIVNAHALAAISEHEPPDLLTRRIFSAPPFHGRGAFRPSGRFANFAARLQRRWLVTDEMLGRGKALEYYDQGNTVALGALVDRRLRRLQRFERAGYRHYVESSQFFIRTFAEETFKRAPNLGLIKLTRDPLENARSLANRGSVPFRHALPPDRTSNRFRIADWSKLSPFQLFVTQWIEQELRFCDFVDAHNVRVFFLETRDLGDAEKVRAMFAYFGIEHRELTDLEARNTNLERGRPRTVVASQDLNEFNAVLELLPDRQRDRIAYLRGYRPRSVA